MSWLNSWRYLVGVFTHDTYVAKPAQLMIKISLMNVMHTQF